MRTINGVEYPDDLRDADLQRANLQDANLQDADLRRADLRRANLQDANLQRANLQRADLQRADLRGANLQDANLRDADLRRANLQDANLRDADLRGADLRDADLRGADLRDADLRCANLQDANLRDADLRRANLRYTKGIEETYVAGEGDIIGYKKINNDIICKLLIPAAAKRSNATGRKCRAEYAVVLEGEGQSCYDFSFYYKVGETVKPTTPFCEDRWNECASGIHFFITREEAKEY